jgi:hypothetical protein
MPQIRRRVSVAANSTINNALAGESLEFVQRPSILTLAATAAATNAITATLRATDDVLMDRALLPVEGLAGQGPILPDNVLLSRQPVAPQDHLLLALTNSTAGAVVAEFILDVQPV